MRQRPHTGLAPAGAQAGQVTFIPIMRPNICSPNGTHSSPYLLGWLRDRSWYGAKACPHAGGPWLRISGASCCSEIPNSLSCDRKMTSFHGWPRGPKDALSSPSAGRKCDSGPECIFPQHASSRTYWEKMLHECQVVRIGMSSAKQNDAFDEAPAQFLYLQRLSGGLQSYFLYTFSNRKIKLNSHSWLRGVRSSAGTFAFHSRAGNSVEMKQVYGLSFLQVLSFPPGSFELVVGAWVLSGLSDLQADDFLHRVLEWLVPEGHFREACGFHESHRSYNSHCVEDSLTENASDQPCTEAKTKRTVTMSSPVPGAAFEERCEFLEEVIEEVLAWQPRVRGGRILYIGPGHGSEVSRLAQEAGHVTFAFHSRGGNSVEMKKSTDKVTYKCDDVTKLSFPPGSFELVVGAWVLSGLSDLQADDFLHCVLEWLVPEGHFAFREACGFLEDPRPISCTLPRSPVLYCQMLRSVTTTSSSFTVLKATSLQSYITYEGDATKMCFVAQRSEVNSGAKHTVDIRYSRSFILRLEWLLGHTWLSTGGESTTKEFCQRLGLRPGQRVLDVGCGSGGSPFFMSRLYGVHVHGVDISSNMIDLAVQRQTHLQRSLRKRVHFELGDIMDADYGDCSFDVIYSRNSILHVAKKDKLFANLFRWLKPGGILFVTDYCAKSTPPSESCACIRHQGMCDFGDDQRLRARSQRGGLQRGVT
ncbi:uncharacterized protein LOC125041253 [Penaeus chinensis]|uniref:uncharacterized protein LOC125041253 n=1 Tax=Penaeus chinensis TaxID=139456 RepID=UPI001FB66480|nr:uncharacterized protein LOC125041253 [Penaeus chinensis]